MNLSPRPSAVLLDPTEFVRPIAHRGLHGTNSGRIENSGSAFEAGLAGGFGIECDLQPANDGTPMVFHDTTLDRLMDARGRIDKHTPAALAKLTYPGTAESILTFGELLELASGRGPLLVEIKSEWNPPHAGFLRQIAAHAQRYKGALALMSFDPAVMVAIAELAPKIPRGIISGIYKDPGWDVAKLGIKRAERLTHLLESRAAAPSFYAYDVKALPTHVTRFVREVQGLPLFTWTVRTAADRKTAAQFADASIFEDDKG